ncbi:hypothetical protein [Roseomonas sp. TAS13]|uniref:hypothetical protein n=1 Tax=Roseomonas sp. TAS13 TaxID=1926319 RepID=UPI001C0D437F|nr:hypothetical protein [Roseomonas sp. TAS13]
MRRRDFSLALMGSAMPLLAPGGKPGGYPAAAATAHAQPAALQRLAERLHRLEEDGLSPADYAIPAEAAVAADPAAHAAGLIRAASAALSDLLLGRLRLPANRPDILRDPAAIPMPRWQLDLPVS